MEKNKYNLNIYLNTDPRQRKSVKKKMEDAVQKTAKSMKVGTKSVEIFLTYNV